MKRLIFTSALLICFFSVFAQTTSIAEILQKIVGVKSVQKIENHPFFNEAFEIVFEQYLDHENTAAGTFNQRIILSHYNQFNPMIMVTEGYTANYGLNPRYINELSRIIEANQIIVEHRYFGKSIPENNNWQYLSIKNASDDLHRIRKIFGKLYLNKWVATGISKGGQSTMAYKAFYPNDVDSWIAYVAPLNFALEDNRIDKYMEKIGTKAIRDKILAFQVSILQNRNIFQPMLDSLIEAQNLSFSIKHDEVLDYCVLEYEFSFWQWGHYKKRIPQWDNNPKEMFAHLMEVSSPDYFDLEKMQSIRPFFIQAAREFGYYGYNTKPLKKHLVVGDSKDYLAKIFLHEDEQFKFDAATSRQISKALNENSKNLMLIYGEYDPWTGAALQTKKTSDAKKFISAKNDHRTRIENLDYEQRTEIFIQLEKWLFD